MNPTPWLRTADGRIRLLVLRTFHFVYKEAGSAQVRQRKFEPGEHLLDPEAPGNTELLAHPWITSYADGAIESPPETLARLQAEAAKASEVHERQQALLRETEVMTARTIAALGSQGRGQDQAGEDLQTELNTPLNQLRPDLAAQLDTPLNKLAVG